MPRNIRNARAETRAPINTAICKAVPDPRAAQAPPVSDKVSSRSPARGSALTNLQTRQEGVTHGLGYYPCDEIDRDDDGGSRDAGSCCLQQEVDDELRG